MRRISSVLAVGLLALALFAFASPASAIDDISIDIDGVVRGNPGDVIEVASTTVDPDLVGATCQAELTDRNNESTHPNNDLIVSSGGQSAVFEDVETQANSVTTFPGDITLGETVVVEIRLGEDGVSSGGLDLVFDCTNAVFPATTVAPTTTEVPTEVLPETQVPAQPAPTPLPETQVEAATAAQPTFTG
jgi:hypothetical protein